MSNGSDSVPQQPDCEESKCNVHDERKCEADWRRGLSHVPVAANQKLAFYEPVVETADLHGEQYEPDDGADYRVDYIPARRRVDASQALLVQTQHFPLTSALAANLELATPRPSPRRGERVSACRRLAALASAFALAGCATARLHTEAQLNEVALNCGLSYGEVVQEAEEKRLLFLYRVSPKPEQRRCIYQWARRNHLNLVVINAVNEPQS